MKRAPLVANAGVATEISTPDFQDTFGADWNLGAGNNQVLNRPPFFFYTALGQGGAATWRKVATIGASTDGTYDQLKLSGVVNENWLAVSNTPIDIVFGNRAVAGTDYTNAIKWSLRGWPIANMRIVAYKEANGDLSIYIFAVGGTFGTCGFSLQWYAQSINVVPPAQVVAQTTAPAGTLVFDSGNVNQIVPLYYQTAALITDFPNGIATGFAPRSVGNAYNEMLGGTPSAIRDVYYQQHRIRVSGVDAGAIPGAFGFATQIMSGSTATTSRLSYRMALRVIDDSVPSWSDPVAYFQGNGGFAAAGAIWAGTLGTPSWAPSDPNAHRLYSTTVQGEADPQLVSIGFTTATTGASVLVGGTYGGGGWNAARSVMYVSTRGDTGRSIATAGTINTSGADYAEYMTKSEGCGKLAKGQVVGIDSSGALTDKFSKSIKFCIKSTDPSFVGGDNWAKGLERPNKPVRILDEYRTVIDVAASPAVDADPEVEGSVYIPEVKEQSHPELVSAGDSDEEWAAKEQAYAQASAEFEAALQACRSKVDRIAFCGQVPVNVLNAVPGQHVVVVSGADDSIATQLVNDADLTFNNWKSSVGQVIAIETDGRARIIVKV